jgi:N-acetylglucosamine-6-sulfatase
MSGESDSPQPGFDRWRFRGQGSYLPVASGLHVDGRRVPQKGYIADEITDYALERMRLALCEVVDEILKALA